MRRGFGSKLAQGLALAGLASIALGLVGLELARPKLAGVVPIGGLAAEVEVALDGMGVPRIVAASEHDALRALGYVTAHERAFQMDLMRRRSAGTLAELFGKELVAHDANQRRLGLREVAELTAARLPGPQRAALEAYAEGVNTYLSGAALLPPEFYALGYRPARWTPVDSVLVVLGIFQDLSVSESLERTRSVIARSLPTSVAAFLYADADPYTRALLGEQSAQAPVPNEALAALGRSNDAHARLAARAGEAAVGSNGWAVAGSRTRDGRAMVANDMHLDLGVPNVWYRAELRYADVTLAGVTLPGVPLIIAGSNGHVAWGLTNLEGDVYDLVALETFDAPPDAYLTPEGSRPFVHGEETLRVRGEPDVKVAVTRTIWGPVAEQRLLGKQVAVRWSALDPAAVDLGLMDIARARSIEDAAAVFNRSGMPPLNALFADAGGRVGWTITGRIPRRRGFDGATTTSWADGQAGWAGYVAPEALPRTLDPEDGFVVNANQRMRGTGEQPLLGHDFGNGYRAHRIAERLGSLQGAREHDLLALQLDTHSGLLVRYRDLALEVLARAPASSQRAALRRVLAAWDGSANVDRAGLPLVSGFRRLLIERVLGQWLAPAQRLEPTLDLDFADVDTPVLRALTESPRGSLAFERAKRDGLVLATLEEASRALAQQHAGREPTALRWGDVSRVEIAHPLGALPLLGLALDMPSEPLAGCGYCVRLADGTLGASERMVVAPGREQDAVFHMPGGQSGNPLSHNYADQQRAWLEGRPLPLLAGARIAGLRLVPSNDAHTR